MYDKGCVCFFCRAEQYPKLWDIYELYASGMPQQDICEIPGIHYRTAIRVRKEWGFPLVRRSVERRYTRSWARTRRFQLAEEMLNDGASFTDIEATLGVSRKALSKEFPGRGWSMEQRSEWLRIAREERQLNLSAKYAV